MIKRILAWAILLSLAALLLFLLVIMFVAGGEARMAALMITVSPLLAFVILWAVNEVCR